MGYSREPPPGQREWPPSPKLPCSKESVLVAHHDDANTRRTESPTHAISPGTFEPWRVISGALAGLTVLALGFIPLAIFWSRTALDYQGLLGFWDFISGTVGDAVLLPAMVGAAVYLAAASPPLSRHIGIAATMSGVLAGAAVQVSWLASTEVPRQWGIPERWHFSLPGWWHAVFFVIVSGALAHMWARIVLSRPTERSESAGAFLILVVSTTGFGLTVIYDANAYGGFDAASTLMMSAVAIVGLTTVAMRAIEAPSERIAYLASGTGLGLLLYVIAREIYVDGSSASVWVAVLSSVAGAGIGLAKWWNATDLLAVGLRPLVPATYMLGYTAASLVTMHVVAWPPLADGLFARLDLVTISADIAGGWEIALVALLAVVGATTTALSRARHGVVEEHHLRVGVQPLLATAALAGLHQVASQGGQG